MIPAHQIDTPEKRRLWEEAYEDFFVQRRWAIENFFKIRTKDQKLQFLKLNEAQDRLYSIVERQEAADVPVRIIGVKPRKVGLSTGIQALFFHTCITRKLQKAMTVAHDMDSTQEMFQMTDLFYHELPEAFQPMTRFFSKEKIVFENPDDETRMIKPGLRSQLTIGTAGKLDLGRSKDIHLLHGSESPYWADAEKTELSLFNAVPNIPSTMIFKEGTPNGVGDKFHRDYEDAKAGRTSFAPFFMAWWEFKEYASQLTVSREEFADSIDDEEQKIIEAYNLTFEQIAWRRLCIRDNCGRDENKFMQEYPDNDVDCFLVSGRPRFNAKKLHDYLLGCVDPVGQGYLRRKGSLVQMEKNDRGYVKIWNPPGLSKRYLIGADVAEGLEYGDYSCGHVYDWDSNEMVAEWHGHIEATEYADELAKLGRIYGTALIGVETNKDGGAAQTLKNNGYPNLFYRQETDHRTKRTTARLGWNTSTVTKPVMIDSLSDAINEGSVIPDKETIKECMTYVYKKDGTLGGQSGCFDDRVMASAIVQEMRKRHGMGRMFPSARR